MSRRWWWVGLIALAVGFGSESAVADSLSLHFPDGAVVFAEAENLEQAADRVLANQALREAYLPLFAGLQNDAGYRRLQAAQQFVRKQLDTDLEQLARQLLGQHVAAALYPSGTKDPDALLVIQASDAAYVAKLADSLLTLVDLFAADKVKVTDQNGVKVADLDGKAFVAVKGATVAASNQRSLLEKYLQLSSGSGAGESSASLGQRADIQQALGSSAKSEGQRLLRGWIDAARLVADSKDPNIKQPYKADNLLGALLVSTTIELVRESPWLGVGIDLRDKGLALTARIPRGAEGLAAEYRSLLPAGAADGALALLQPKGYLAGFSLFGDLNQAYAHRETLIRANNLPEIDKFEDGLQNLLPGRDFSTDVLPSFGPRLQLLFARQSYEHLPAKPEVELPAGALVWQMADAKKGGDLMKLLFQTVVAILNFTSNERGGEPMVTDLVSHQGTTITFGTYLNPPTKDALPISFNYTPALAVLDNYVIAGSSVDLVRSLIDEIKAGRAAATAATGRLGIEAGTAVDLIEANRSIAQARLVQQGRSAERAEQELNAFLTLLRQFRGAALTVESGRDQSHLQLEVQW